MYSKTHDPMEKDAAKLLPAVPAIRREEILVVKPVSDGNAQVVVSEAILQYANGALGPAATATVSDFAPNVQDALDRFNQQRRSAMGSAESELSALPPSPPLHATAGELAGSQIADLLHSKNVPRGESGNFDVDNLTGNEPIDPVTASALEALRRTTSNAVTPMDLLNQRRNIDAAGIPNFDVPPDRAQALKNQSRGLINSVLSNLVNNSGVEGLPERWADANDLYGAPAKLMGKLGQMNNNDLFGPEELTKVLANRRIAPQALDTLRTYMDPQDFDAIDKAGANYILQNSRTTPAGELPEMESPINAKSLLSNIRQGGRGGEGPLAPLYRGLNPDTQQSLSNIAEMMRTAGMDNLRTFNPSGSGLLESIQNRKGLQHWIPDVLGAAADVPYYGGNAVVEGLKNFGDKYGDQLGSYDDLEPWQ